MKTAFAIFLICFTLDLGIGKNIVKRNCNEYSDYNCNQKCTTTCTNTNNCNQSPGNCNDKCSSPCQNKEVEPSVVPVLVPFPPPVDISQAPTAVNNTNNSNFTADVTLTNTINTVNNISIPISVNSTNENTITIYLENPDVGQNLVINSTVNETDENCCFIMDEICDQNQDCYIRKHWTCSPICKGEIGEVTDTPLIQSPVTAPPPITLSPIEQPQNISVPFVPWQRCMLPNRTFTACPQVQPVYQPVQPVNWIYPQWAQQQGWFQQPGATQNPIFSRQPVVTPKPVQVIQPTWTQMQVAQPQWIPQLSGCSQQSGCPQPSWAGQPFNPIPFPQINQQTFWQQFGCSQQRGCIQQPRLIQQPSWTGQPFNPIVFPQINQQTGWQQSGCSQERGCTQEPGLIQQPSWTGQPFYPQVPVQTNQQTYPLAQTQAYQSICRSCQECYFCDGKFDINQCMNSSKCTPFCRAIIRNCVQFCAAQTW